MILRWLVILGSAGLTFVVNTTTAARNHLGGFEDEAELVSFAGLDPITLDQVRDRIILL